MHTTSETIQIIDIPELPEACLIRLSGNLDDKNTAMDDCFSRIMEGDKKHVIADMSGITIMTSATIGKLLGIKKRLAEKEGDLVLAALDVKHKMQLNLMGVNKIFKIFNDLRAATSAYAWEVKHEAELVKISFPSDLRVVPPIRHFISQALRNKGYSDRDSFRIETIVDEICNNAVQHGIMQSNDNITLRMKINWDKVELDAENVSDPHKIDSLKVHLDNLKNAIKFHTYADGKRGRGLALVKMLASELSADVTPTGTTVHVTKLKEG
jgi:anti-anti-sigma factor